MCFGGDKKTQDSNQASNSTGSQDTAASQNSNVATNQNTAGTNTSAPTNPNIDPAVSGLVQSATSLAQNPLSLYQGQMVAPLTANQNTAIGQINSASSLAQPYFGQASTAFGNINPITSQPFDQSQIDKYTSPYLNDVINATSGNIDESNQEQQQSLAGNITAAGAWGGDRSAVLQSELARQQALAKNQTIAGLRDSGYQNAQNEYNTVNNQSLAAQQANNASQLSLASGYAGLGSAVQNSALTGANALFNAGTAEQQVNQENLNVPYQQYLQQQAYPYQNLDFLSQILSGAAGTSGTTTNQTGSLAGNVTGDTSGTSNSNSSSNSNSTGQQTGKQSSDIGSTLLGGALSLASFLKDGGRARLADGGLPSIPQVVGYVPSIQPSGRVGLAPPGIQNLGDTSAAAPSLSMGQSSGSSSSPSGSLFDPNMFSGGSNNDVANGEAMGTKIGNANKDSLSDFGHTLFGGGSGESNGGGDFIGSASDSGGLFGGVGSFLKSLKDGGRPKLAAGGFDEPVYGDDEPVIDVPVPSGASAMSLADTPAAWRGQSTNFAPAPSAGPQGGSLAQNTDTDYSPPPGLDGVGLTAGASNPPAWDDGTPITAGGGGASLASGNDWGAGLSHPAKVVEQLHQATPDWRRALLTAGTSMMASHSGNGLKDVGAGFQAGVKNYYDQLDRDNHPEVDHSGPTTTVRYADGTVVDTGIPTEAAINAQATNSYRIANSQQISADRQAAIQQRADAAKERADNAKQAAEDRKLYQQGLLALRSDGANQGRYTYQPATQDDPVTGKPVSGYLRLSTKGEEAPQFISGYTPLKGSSGAGGMQGGREGVMFNRVVSAGNAATAAAKNIMELPSDTNSGWFAGRHQGPGLLGATKESLTNTLTSQDVQDYNSMVPGITRNLGALETQGLAVPGSMTHSMDGVLLKQGDTEVTKLRKMAEMRQIIETNLEPQLSNPRVPTEQKQLVTKIIGDIQKTIPFTHHDITELEKSGKGSSLADVAGKRGLGGGQQGGAHKFTEGQVLHQNGHTYKVVNGVPVAQSGP